MFNSPSDLFIILIVIALYIYSAYCLVEIARKTNTPNEWMAWIPFLNLALMVKIARLPLWWIIGLIVPYVNIVVAAYIWWKIAEERRRPGWWGILMIITPINLVLIWFLAFKEAENQIAPVNTPPSNPTTPAA